MHITALLFLALCYLEIALSQSDSRNFFMYIGKLVKYYRTNGPLENTRVRALKSYRFQITLHIGQSFHFQGGQRLLVRFTKVK